MQARLDAALSESAVLESQDKQLATEIARDQAALAAQPTPVGGVDHGTALPPIGNINVVSAGGIYVNAQIASNVSALLAAAQADGVPLAGWGYQRHEHADRASAGALWLEPIHDLHDALLRVLTADRATRHVDARAWPCDRLHLRRLDDRQPQQPRLQVARRPRLAVRPLQPAVGALALVDERELALSGYPASARTRRSSSMSASVTGRRRNTSQAWSTSPAPRHASFPGGPEVASTCHRPDDDQSRVDDDIGHKMRAEVTSLL